jgi:hypothetical protein
MNKKVAYRNDRGGEGGITQALRAFGPPFGRYPRFVTLAANRSKPTKIYLMYGGEGGIARRYAPRPFAPLRDRRRSRAGVSLLNRLPLSRLNL